MNQTIKRILLGLGIGGGAVLALLGGLTFYRNASRKPVNVYSLDEIAMTDYWEDSREIYGSVTADRLQNVFLSETETVTEVFVTEGQNVKAGDPLFSYDTTLSDLNVKKAENDLLQKKRSLEKAEALLVKLKNTKPYTESPIIDPVYPDVPDDSEEPEVPETNPEETPKLLSGAGTKASPFVYLWGEEDELDEEFLEQVIEELIKRGVVPDTFRVQDEPLLIPDDGSDTNDEDVVDHENDGSSEVDGDDGNETNPEEESDSSDSNEQPSDTGYTPMSMSMSSGIKLTSDKPDVTVYLVLERRTDNDPSAELESEWGVKLRRENGKLYTSLFVPMSPARAYDDDGSSGLLEDNYDYSYDSGSSYDSSSIEEYETTYTKAELEQAINDTTLEIRDLNLEVKLAEVELKRMKAELGDGHVYAALDGVVKKVMDPDEAFKNSKSFITVSAGGGYRVEVPVSELTLGDFRVGDSVAVMSYESGTYAEGEVESISGYPTSNDSYWGSGNPNVSYYPCTIFVDESVELKEGEFVNVTYGGGMNASGSSFYLENMFIRSDASGSYVYVKAEDGTLEKRRIVTGKSTGWGAIEVKSGLSLEERVAFPYGSNVVEGALTTDAGYEDLYEGM